MTRSYRAERMLGGQLVFDHNDDPLDKHLAVASLSPHRFNWGPAADETAVLQLAIAILTDRYSWIKAVDSYRDLAAYIQDEFGEQDDWELPRSDVMNATRDSDGSDRFDDHLPAPEAVDITEVDLDEMTRATESALCERYGVNRHGSDSRRREKLEDIKENGPNALGVDDESRPESALGSFDDENESAGNSGRSGADIDSDPQPDTGEPMPTDTTHPEAGDVSERDETGAPPSDGTATPGDDGDAPNDHDGGADDNGETTTPSEEAADAAGQGIDACDDTPSDTSGSPVEATPDRVAEAFPVLSTSMATSLADCYSTVEAVLSATPTELLEHEGIDRTIITRLTETIGWSVATPIGDQRDDDPTRHLESGEPIDDQPTAPDAHSDDTAGNQADAPSEGGDTAAAESPSTEGSDSGETSHGDGGTAWVPTANGYSVRGAHSARIFQERQRPGNYDVFLESEAGETSRVAQNLPGTGADRLTHRLSNAVDPVDIEHGGDRLEGALAAVDGATLPDHEEAGDTTADTRKSAADGSSGSSIAPTRPADATDADGHVGGDPDDDVDTEQGGGADRANAQDEDTGPEDIDLTEAGVEDSDGEGTLRELVPDTLEAFALQDTVIDRDAGLLDCVYTAPSDIPSVDVLTITVRRKSLIWAVYIGPDGDTHPRGTFDTLDDALNRARAIATDSYVFEDESESSTTHSQGSDNVEASGEPTALTPRIIKSDLDIHGPPAHALADAFENKHDLVAYDASEDAFTAIEGVGETTAARLEEALPEIDVEHVADDTSEEEGEGSSRSSPDTSSASKQVATETAATAEEASPEFVWADHEKPIHPV